MDRGEEFSGTVPWVIESRLGSGVQTGTRRVFLVSVHDGEQMEPSIAPTAHIGVMAFGPRAPEDALSTEEGAPSEKAAEVGTRLRRPDSPIR